MSSTETTICPFAVADFLRSCAAFERKSANGLMITEDAVSSGVSSMQSTSDPQVIDVVVSFSSGAFLHLQRVDSLSSHRRLFDM